MLIVDMPMPREGGCHIAVDWDGHSFVCPIKRKTCDYFFSKKRPDWCPIKGELVRCGECKYWDRSDPFFFNGVVRCECKRHENEYWTADGFCSDAERNDSEIPNS